MLVMMTLNNKVENSFKTFVPITSKNLASVEARDWQAYFMQTMCRAICSGTIHHSIQKDETSYRDGFQPKRMQPFMEVEYNRTE
jgi:hypothetical protein